MEQPPEPHVPHGYRVRRASEQSILWKIAPYTDRVDRNSDHSLSVHDYVEIPYDEYGVIDRKEFLTRLVGSVASDYHWDGSKMNTHHLVWPRRVYRPYDIDTPYTKITGEFRENPSLKIILPVDLHMYLHGVTEIPNMPDLDVMDQRNLEQRQVSSLFEAVRYDNLEDLSYEHLDKEMFRYALLLERLDHMEDGHVGLMPDREMLAALPLAESRQLLRHLARPIGFSACKACQQVFFA